MIKEEKNKLEAEIRKELDLQSNNSIDLPNNMGHIYIKINSACAGYGRFGGYKAKTSIDITGYSNTDYKNINRRVYTANVEQEKLIQKVSDKFYEIKNEIISIGNSNNTRILSNNNKCEELTKKYKAIKTEKDKRFGCNNYTLYYDNFNININYKEEVDSIDFNYGQKNILTLDLIEKLKNK